MTLHDVLDRLELPAARRVLALNLRRFALALMEDLYAVGWRAPGRSRQWVLALGVLQRLARADFLKRIDIGGALTWLLSRTTDPGATGPGAFPLRHPHAPFQAGTNRCS